ncbi:hypothetical protein GGER_04920 [Serratia rubidaea]
MIPSERRDFIYRYVHEYQLVPIAALTELMSVSHMTVRRDIRVLEEEGKVVSVSGGVRLSDALRQELAYNEKCSCTTAISAPSVNTPLAWWRMARWSIWTPAPPPLKSPATWRSAST